MSARTPIAAATLAVWALACSANGTTVTSRPEPTPTAARAPAVLADGLAAPRLLRLDGDWLYWTEDVEHTARIVRMERSGGARQDLVYLADLGGADGLIDDIAVEGQWLYALTNERAIYRLPKGGGTATAVVDQDPEVASIRAFRPRGDDVYWVANDRDTPAGTLHRTATSTGAAEVIGRSKHCVCSSLPMDDRHVYWAVGDASGNAVVRAPLAGGGTAAVVLETPVQACELALAGDTLYAAQIESWAQGTESPDADSILAVPKGGGAARAIATGPFLHPRIDTTGEHIYWRTRPGRHGVTQTIMRSDQSGRDRRVIAADQPDPTHLIITSDALLWANTGVTERAAGAVVSLPIE